MSSESVQHPDGHHKSEEKVSDSVGSFTDLKESEKIQPVPSPHSTEIKSSIEDLKESDEKVEVKQEKVEVKEKKVEVKEEKFEVEKKIIYSESSSSGEEEKKVGFDKNKVFATFVKGNLEDDVKKNKSEEIDLRGEDEEEEEKDRELVRVEPVPAMRQSLIKEYSSKIVNAAQTANKNVVAGVALAGLLAIGVRYILKKKR